MGLHRLNRLSLLCAALLAAPAQASPQSAAVALIDAYQFTSSSEGFDSGDDFCPVWAWGEPDQSSSELGTDPMWATARNAGNPPDSDGDLIPELEVGYLNNCALSVLRSPTLPISEIQDVTVALVHAFETETGDETCATGLAEGNDVGCGDGGVVRLAYGDHTVLLSPSSGYLTPIALEGEAVDGFGGSSGGWLIHYFDLRDREAGDTQLELVFTSNSESPQGNGWAIDRVEVYEGDIIPPTVSIPEPLSDTADIEGPYRVDAIVTDNRDLASVQLNYWTGSGATRQVVMTPDPETPDGWFGNIPGQPTGTDVQYWVVATDIYYNRTTYPPGKPLVFRVRLAAPTGLALVEMPAQDTQLELVWQAAVQEGYVVVGYEVEHSIALDSQVQVLGLVADLDGSTTDLHATVVPQGYPYEDQFAVQALYLPDRDGDGTPDEGDSEPMVGDLSNKVVHTLVVPSISSVTPDVAYQGYSLLLTVIGNYTTFVQDDMHVDLGPGVEVIEVDVRDVSYCTVSTQIAADAEPGPRTLRITWPESDPTYALTIEQEAALTIKSSDAHPRIERVDPSTVEQGDQIVIKFLGANTDFVTDRPIVEFVDSSGIRATGEVGVLSATGFQIPIEIATWANVGKQPVTVISGDQVFLVDLQVVPPDPVTGGSCSMQTCATQGASTGLSGRGTGMGSLTPLVLMVYAHNLLRRRRREGELRLRGDYVERSMDSRHGDTSGPDGDDEPGPAGGGRSAGLERRCS